MTWTVVKLFVQELMSFVRSYVVPEGFPDSVTPAYVPYMTWRALKVRAIHDMEIIEDGFLAHWKVKGVIRLKTFAYASSFNRHP